MTLRSPDSAGDAPFAELPLTTPGRSVGWGGVALLAVIELIVIGSMIASYFYLRVGTPLWPPPDAGMPRLLLAGVGQGLLTLSAAPAYLSERAWRLRADGRPLAWLFPIGFVMVAAYAALKVLEYAQVSYTWASHAYGSISWTLTGYQLLHTVVLLVFGLVVWTFARIGGLGAQRSMAVECVALYWYFLVVSSLLEFITTHLSPYLL